MKCKKILIILISIISLMICFEVSKELNIRYLFAGMRYGISGSNNGDIVFSKDSGFYKDEFKLRL